MYDAIVVGLGAMGSAAVAELARRGLRVLGIDQYAPLHAFGSSHGDTRIVRSVYADERYAPLLDRAYAQWLNLEAHSGETLVCPVGHLTVSPPGDEMLVARLARSARRTGAEHEVLTSRQLQERFAAFDADAQSVGFFEPRAGYLFVAPALRAMRQSAEAAQAELLFECAVMGWSQDQSGARVVTATGDYLARRLVITAGAWASTLLRELGLPLEVRGVSQAWFDATANGCDDSAHDAPCFTVEASGASFFGVPCSRDQTLKLGGQSHPFAFHPHDTRRVIPESERERLQSTARTFASRLAGRRVRESECLTTHTPDDRFLIDVDPRDPRVVIAAGFSGHGFKFAPVIGELVADLVQGRARDASTRFLAFGERHLAAG